MKKLNFLILICSLIFFYTGCGEDNGVVTPGGGNKSDLTRTGKFITFTSDLDGGDFDIYLAEVDTNGNLVTSGTVYSTNPYNLTNSFNTAADKQSNWSPDGRIMVFSSTQGNNQEIYAYFFNADGSIDTAITQNPKNLFSSDGNWDNNPSFSPDGKYLIWDRANIMADTTRDIYIGDVTGSGNSLQVANRRAIKTTTGVDEYNPKWSPRISVRRIAYENKPAVTSTDHDVFVIDPFDTTNNVVFFNPNSSGYPAWSPACNRIIFESDHGNGGFYKIVSLDYPSNSGTLTDIVQSSTQNLRYPTWLPNGNILAYVRIDAVSGNGNIYTVPSTGGVGFGSKLLPSNFDAANNLWPAW